ncbi:MAG: TonB family protein, partial [Magnetococcales bacterium]|nr:TonB family protein [Magnetococcales bacterium]
LKPEPEPIIEPEPIVEPEPEPIVEPEPIIEPPPKIEPLPEPKKEPLPSLKVSKKLFEKEPEKVAEKKKPLKMTSSKPKVKPKPMATPAPKKLVMKKIEKKKVEKKVEKKTASLDFSKAIARLNQGKKSTNKAQPAPPPRASRLTIALWQRKLRMQVRNNWTKPGGLRNEYDLEVMVRVAVGPDGSLQNANIIRGSGNNIYDRSVLRAIFKTTAIEAPPRGCKECRSLDFVFRPTEE